MSSTETWVVLSETFLKMSGCYSILCFGVETLELKGLLELIDIVRRAYLSVYVCVMYISGQ